MSKKILVADDSLSMRSMISMTLKGAGFEVTEAADGATALTKAKVQQFNLVLTDKNMPNMTGIELLKALRQLPAYRAVPILLLTTDGNSDSKGEGRAAGATGWLVKPFRPEVLCDVVKKLIG